MDNFNLGEVSLNELTPELKEIIENSSTKIDVDARIAAHNTSDTAHSSMKTDITALDNKVTTLSNSGFLSQEKFVSGNLIDYIKSISIGKSISVYVGSHNVSNMPVDEGFFLMQIFRNPSTGDVHIRAQEFVGNNLTGNQWVADLWNFTGDKIPWKQIATTNTTLPSTNNNNGSTKLFRPSGVYAGTFTDLPPQLPESYRDGQGVLEVRVYTGQTVDSCWREISFRSAHNMSVEYKMEQTNDKYFNWKQVATTDIVFSGRPPLHGIDIDMIKEIGSVRIEGRDDVTITGTFPEGFDKNSMAWTHLDVFPDGAYVRQVLTCTNNNVPGTYGVSFQRIFTNVWSPWVRLATTTKIDISLLNGWQPVWGGSNNVICETVGDLVHVRGMISGGKNTTGTVVFRLPMPNIDTWFYTPCHGLNELGYFYLGHDGDVTIQNLPISTERNYMIDFCYRRR